MMPAPALRIPVSVSMIIRSRSSQPFAAADLLSDPRAQGIIDQLDQARVRDKGGLVLAPMPRL